MFRRLKTLWHLSDHPATEEHVAALFDKLSALENKTDKVMEWMSVLLRAELQRREREEENESAVSRSLRSLR
jgi:hypothetical protein